MSLFTIEHPERQTRTNRSVVKSNAIIREYENMTLEEYIYLEPKAIRFAKWYYSKRQLSLSQAEDDAHDVVTDLYFNAPSFEKKSKTQRIICYMHRIRSRIKDKAKALWTKQGKVLTTGLSIDEAPKGEIDDDGDEEDIETALLSDGGKSAAEIRSFDEPGQEPPFIYLVRAEVENLGPIRKRLAKAIMRYRFRDEARRFLKMCNSTFWKLIRSMRANFEDCLEARNLYFETR